MTYKFVPANNMIGGNALARKIGTTHCHARIELPDKGSAKGWLSTIIRIYEGQGDKS